MDVNAAVLVAVHRHGGLHGGRGVVDAVLLDDGRVVLDEVQDAALGPSFHELLLVVRTSRARRDTRQHYCRLCDIVV